MQATHRKIPTDKNRAKKIGRNNKQLLTENGKRMNIRKLLPCRQLRKIIIICASGQYEANSVF